MTTTVAETLPPANTPYTRLLDQLREERSGTMRAQILHMLAAAAEQDVDADWRASAPLLHRLADTQLGEAQRPAAGDGPWAQVAAATTEDEFDEAITLVLNALPPRTRSFPRTRLTEAALACAASYPAAAHP